MQRRHVLSSLGALGLLGLGRSPFQTPGDALRMRLWFTEAAAEYGGVERRVEECVRAAFEDVCESVDLSVGPPVAVPTEEAFDLMASGAWPTRLLAGAAGLGRLDPVWGVNLLVTDGDVMRDYTGMGAPYVAAVSGAGQIARLDPRAVTRGRVPFSLPALRMQVLLHEVGHTLGLRHEHGRLDVRRTYAVASPMVSTYPWMEAAAREGQFSFERGPCGATFPDVTGKGCVLSFEFSACARRALRG